MQMTEVQIGKHVNRTSEQLQTWCFGSALQGSVFLSFRERQHTQVKTDAGPWTWRCCRTKDQPVEKPDGLPEWRRRCYGVLGDDVVRLRSDTRLSVGARWDSGALSCAFKTAQQQGSHLVQPSPSYTTPIRPWPAGTKVPYLDIETYSGKRGRPRKHPLPVSKGQVKDRKSVV